MRYLITLALLLGCVPAQAIKQARIEVAVNTGHAGDTALPPVARLIAQDSLDAWAAQLYLLDGTELPAATVARLTSRGHLPAGYGE